MKPKSNRYCRTILQRILYTGTAGLAMLATHAMSATVTMTASDSGSTYSFISAGNWSNASAPSAGNDYESDGFLIQYSGTVPDGGYTFAGDSLTLKNGARFASGLETIGGGRWLTINNLTLDNGRISHSRGGGNPITMTGSMTIAAGGATLYADQDSLTWAGSVTGSGPLAITQGTVSFTGSQSHTSNVTISSGATFSAAPSGTLANGGTMIFSHGDARAFDASGYSGNGNIIKRGAGTLTASGAWTIAGNLEVGYSQVGNSGSVVLGSGSSLSVGSGSSNHFYVGVGTGSDGSNGPTGVLNASASNGVTANVGIFRVGGTVGGNGTLNLGATNTITAATEFGVNHGQWGFPNGFGAVTTAASSTTTINTPSLIVGKTTPNGTTGGYGEFTLGDGATFNLAGTAGGRTTMEVGIHNSGNGASHGTSFMNLSGAGTGIADLTLSSLVLGDLQGGGSNGVTGNLTLSSSASNQLDISGNSNGVAVVQVARSRAGAPATATLTIGHLGSDSQIVSLDNGTAILLARKESSGSATGTLNLGAGTLTVTTTGSAIAGGGGTSNLNIDGTTLKAGASSSTWIQDITNAKIKSGGVTFDTNGHNIAVSQALLEDSGSTGGGLTKLGSGTLTLSGGNTFTGATTVTGGKLVVTSSSALLSTSVSIGAAELQFNSTTPLAAAPVFTSTGGRFNATGTINGSLDVTDGNTLAVINPAGTLTLTGLTLGDDTTVEVASGGSSLVQVNGDFTDSMGAHSLITGLATPDTPYPFIQWTGTTNISDGLQSNWSIQEGDTGTKNWTAATSGTWETAASWDGFAAAVTADTTAKTLSYSLSYAESGNKAPTAGNDVVINPATSSITVTGPTAASTAKSLQVGGANNSSPTLTLGTGSLTVTETVTVTGNGTLNATTSALIAPILNVNSAGAAATLGHAGGSITTANVSAGTLTVSAGTVSTTNLSGTGSLTGSQVLPQVNITGGTPTFSGNATVMTVTGGGVTTTGGSIGTLIFNTGSGTTTIGADTLVTTANVNAGIVNFNSTQSNGTLTLPVDSTGTFVAGAGARFAIVDLTAGAGTVTAENPLTIANELLLADDFSVTTDGPAFTAQTATGENLVSNTANRTFTATGGKMTLATEGAPALTGISYTQVTNDADSGITSDKTYTHALDWGASGAATVNGVAFATDMNQSVGGRSNSGTRTYGAAGSHPGSTPPAVSGSVAGVFQDMVYGGPDPGHIELTGLTAGNWYNVKLYDRPWDGSNGRSSSYVYDVGGNGSAEFTTPVIDQNHSEYAPVSLASNVSWVTSYIYQADATGKLRLSIDGAPNQSGTYHLYGLTNEVVPAGSGEVNFPNTHIAASATSEISLGSSSADQVVGNLSVIGNNATVTLSGAQSISLNNISATETGTVAGSVPISLRGGNATVAPGKSLTVNSPVVDGTSPTSLTKLDGGTLTLAGTNSYTGATVVSGGTLALGASASLNTSGIELEAGTTLDTTAQSYAIPAAKPVTIHLDSAGAGSSGKITAASLDISSASVVVEIDNETALNDPVYVLAEYTSLTGTEFSSVTAPPSGYAIDYNYNGENKIAWVQESGGDYAAWDALYDEDLSDPAADFDGDGLSNFQEYAFGLNPISAASSNPIGDVSQLKTNGIFTYSRRFNSGLTYTVWSSGDLQEWDDVTPVVTESQLSYDEETGIEVIEVGFAEPPTATNLFVRVKAEEPAN